MNTDHISLAEYRRRTKKARTDDPRGPKMQFLNQLHFAGLPSPEREVLFAQPRKWRLDFAYPDAKIGIEYQGIFGRSNTSHASLGGLRRDYEKFTEAALRGWLMILISAETVRTGQAVEWVRQALEMRAREAA